MFAEKAGMEGCYLDFTADLTVFHKAAAFSKIASEVKASPALAMSCLSTLRGNEVMVERRIPAVPADGWHLLAESS